MPKCDFNKEMALRHGFSPVNCLHTFGKQEIFRRTPMPKCDFSVEITFWHGCSPVNVLHIFGTSIPNNTWGLLLVVHTECYNTRTAGYGLGCKDF